MRKHYLLLAHDQPDHVSRLVGRLDDGEATFWLHLDARADLGEWASVTAHDSVVVVEPRVRCIWGTWSMVEAQLAQVRACLAGGEPGYLVMLSGQSYPVKSTAQVDAYLSSHADLVHMDLWRLEERWPDNHRDRLDYFCLPTSEDKGALLLLRQRQEMNARELLGWTRRLVREQGARQAATILRTIGERRPDVADLVMGGSQWWAMPWDTAQDLISYDEAHPEIADFLRWSQFPDESFVQTLLTLLDGTLEERLGPTLTLVDWTEGDWDLPRVMTERDVPALLDTPDHVLFARKFVPPGSTGALSALDAAIGTGGRR